MTQATVHNVLVVDDEPDICELLVDALTADELRVATASSGGEAIRIARKDRPDILVTDLLLGDCTGLDVIDQLGEMLDCSIPAVVITGQGDPKWLSEASRRRPVELITKPLDIDRLRNTIESELQRQRYYQASQQRSKKLRKLARSANIEKKDMERKLKETCADLTQAYRTLSGKLSMQEIVLGYQNELIGARMDDDVFRSLFRTFVRRSGPVFGISLVCDANAQLRIVGRFGVPHPDSLEFCQQLSEPVVDLMLSNPQTTVLDATDEADLFPDTIRKYLIGVNVMAVPLIPSPGELIGVVIFYRKGEQPFTEFDMSLSEMIGPSTAMAVRRND